MKNVLYWIFLICFGFTCGFAAQSKHSVHDTVVFTQGLMVGWWMRDERMVNNIQNDPRIDSDTKDRFQHQPKPDCYNEWKDIINSYDYGQCDYKQ